MLVDGRDNGLWALAGYAGLFAFLTVLAREVWFLPIVVVALLFAIRRDLRVAAVSIVGATAGLAIALLQPAIGSVYPTGTGHTIRAWADAHFGSVDGAIQTFWSVLFGACVVVLAPLCAPRALRFTRSALRSSNDRLVPAVMITVTQLAIAGVGGSDVSRLAFAAAPFAVAVGLALVFADRQILAGAVLLMGAIVFWRPFVPIAGGPTAYEDFYYPPSVGTTWATVIAVIALLAALGLATELMPRNRCERLRTAPTSGLPKQFTHTRGGGNRTESESS